MDNWQENLGVQGSKICGYELKTTQRLDHETSGLVVMGHSDEFVSRFNKLLREGLVLKVYVSKTRTMPKPKVLVHHMKDSERAPKILTREPQADSKICVLSVLHSWPSGPNEFSSAILLLTGRTHQIRAQMAFEGHPLLGDPLYGLEPAATMGLRSSFLAFKFQGKVHQFTVESQLDPIRLHSWLSSIPALEDLPEKSASQLSNLKTLLKEEFK